MIDEMTMTTVVTASPEDCYALISDIEQYPEWADGVSSATVIERDLDGRAAQASRARVPAGSYMGRREASAGTIAPATSMAKSVASSIAAGT